MSAIKNKDFTQGVISMLASSLCVASMCFLGKALSENLALSLLVFIRFFCPFLLSVWMLVTLQGQTLKTTKPLLHIVRAACAVAGQYSLFYTLTRHSVLMATLLFSTGPLFVPIITALVYKTPVKRAIWLSIGLGFIGITCVLHPDAHGVWNLGLFVGLGAGFFNACSQVTFHGISQKDSALCSSFYMFGISMLIALGPMLVSWYMYHLNHEFSYMLDSDLLLILILFSLFSMSNQMFRSKAYQYAKPIHMAPFWYASIPITALMDWQFRGAVPDLITVFGCICVVLGGLLMIYYKNQQVALKTKVHVETSKTCPQVSMKPDY